MSSSRYRRDEAKPIVALTTRDKARIAAEVEAISKRKRYQLLLEKYDTHRSGKLKKDQMMKLLTELDTSTPTGHPPSEEEIEFIMKFADTEGSWMGFSDGGIDAFELEKAVVAWLTYLDYKGVLDETFEQFDKNRTGQLDKAELRDYLKSLNGGQAVTDEEVRWVLGMADINRTGDLNRPETLIATLEWYTYVKTGKMSAINHRKVPGACCNVL